MGIPMSKEDDELEAAYERVRRASLIGPLIVMWLRLFWFIVEATLIALLITVINLLPLHDEWEPNVQAVVLGCVGLIRAAMEYRRGRSQCVRQLLLFATAIAMVLVGNQLW